MMSKIPIARICVVLLLAVVAAAPLFAQEPAAVSLNASEMKFINFPVLPSCATGAVVSGDPGKGGSVIFSKVQPGCVFPWHWHTPNESVMIVSGAARVEMKDGKAVTLKAGGFSLLPSKHVHQFTCVKPNPCSLFVHSDVAFDMHYVKADGSEITPEEALKAVKESLAKPK